MHQNRTQRIHRGFHRVGILLGAIVLLLGAAIAFAMRTEPDKVSEVVLIFVAVATAVYALSRAIGWIIAGFAGD